jgi:hypothetical protein
VKPFTIMIILLHGDFCLGKPNYSIQNLLRDIWLFRSFYTDKDTSSLSLKKHIKINAILRHELSTQSLGELCSSDVCIIF